MTTLRCVSVSTRNMIVSKAVVFTVFLLATLNFISTKPHPSITRERHIIHTPINFRVIHHYKIRRVPLIIKKHLHYHKPYTQEARAAPEETQDGLAYLEDSKEYLPGAGVHLKDEREVTGWRGKEEGKGYPFGYQGYEVPSHSPGEEDENSEEEDYEEVEENEEKYGHGDYEW